MSPAEPRSPEAFHVEHLTTARWFGGKGRAATVTAVTPLPWLSAPGAAEVAIRPEIATVGYDDGTEEAYQLLLAHGPERPGAVRIEDPELGVSWVSDATGDPVAGPALWHGLADHAGDGVLGVHRLTNFGAAPPARRFGGEQSNTSVLYGDRALVKVFRRLEVGRNLDIEVHDALTRRGNTDAARLLGHVEAVLPAGPVDLIMVVEQLTGAVDGWQAALDALRAGDSFADRAHALGRSLAGVHTVLAEAFGRDEVAGERLAAVMADHLAAYTAVVAELAPYADALRGRYSRLAGRSLPVQRVHGDAHLGQALITPQGWKIIDFEGEPVKSLAERARPDSPFRDVAGFLRSFSYAVATVTDPGCDPGTWRDDCRSAFLSGYAGTGALDTDVITAYEADRAAYEMVYEARNRPTWIPIPLADVARLADPDRADRPAPADPEEKP